MNRFLGVTLMAVVLAALAAQSAQAGYCGAASFKLCSAMLRRGELHRRTAALPHRHEDLQGGRLRKAELHLLQDGLRAGHAKHKTIDCVKYVAETRYRDVRVHGLQAGLGNQDPRPAATRSASRCTRPAPRTSATPSASRSRRPRRTNICYTVCKPVYETKTQKSATRSASRSTKPRPANICYTVCKPVYETKT